MRSRRWARARSARRALAPHCVARRSSRRPARAQVVLDRRYHNRELEMMKKLDHESVIKLHHHFEKP